VPSAVDVALLLETPVGVLNSAESVTVALLKESDNVLDVALPTVVAFVPETNGEEDDATMSALVTLVPKVEEENVD